MNTAHDVIIIPGLGDDTMGMSLATGFWRLFGFNPIIHSFAWKDGSRSFEEKMSLALKLVDRSLSGNRHVSLIGTSAGGSAVMNMFLKRRRRVCAVVTVCARLKKGDQTGFRSLAVRSASSPSFRQSIIDCEHGIPKLSPSDLGKICTVSALFGDELVPKDTSMIRGANNIFVPSGEHMLSIATCLTIGALPVIRYLKRMEEKQ